jgi:ribose 5-phosphate isomerase A
LATKPDFEQEKRLVAAEGVSFIEDGMKVGLGSGSTASYFVNLLGERVRSGLRIQAVPTSLRTQSLARKVGIPLTSFAIVRRLDVTVDGADEIDGDLNLIKGGGGALLWEKIVAAATDHLVIIGDSRKRVTRLGTFPLPVEVVPFGWQLTAERIGGFGCQVALRTQSGGEPFLTMENNYILDCRFGAIDDPGSVAAELDHVPGVVEHGLFIGLAKTALIAQGDRVQTVNKS